MQPALVYRTPLWKEAALLLLAGAFIAVGAVCLYVGHIEARWEGYLIGGAILLFGVVNAIMNMSTNTVLRLDAEGVFIQMHFLSKKRVPWSAVKRFEKTVQTFYSKDQFGTAERQMAYLTILLTEPEEPGILAHLAHAALSRMSPRNAADPAVARQREGHYTVPAIQLPGNIDDVVRQVRAYHMQVTNGAVQYDPEEVLPSSKGSYKPSLLTFLLIFGMVLILGLGAASYLTGMSVVEMGSAVFE